MALYRDGAITYEHGYGLANIEHDVPITPQTVFDIGSTSKQFTAFAILLLQRQGKLSIDDDVRKYIPELPDYGKTITLRHLLTHTSGLRDYTSLFDLAGFAEQEDLSQFVGNYESPELNATWVIRLANGQLTAGTKRGLTPPEALIPVSENTFMTDSVSIKFISQPGQSRKALVSADRIRNLEFTAVQP